MTEEELFATIQQKEQEKIENKLEERKAYRDSLLKCTEQRSSFKRGLYFFIHYVGLLYYLCFMAPLYFLLGILAFLLVKNSFHEFVAVILMIDGFVFVFSTIVFLRSKGPSFGFSDEGIYEEIRWISREIKALEKQREERGNEK